MFRTQVYSSAICFSAICFSASVGFSQEFLPDRNPASNVGRNQIVGSNVFRTPMPASSSAGVTTKTYGGFTAVQKGVVQDDVGQGQGDVGRGDVGRGDVGRGGVGRGGVGQGDVSYARVAQGGVVQDRVFQHGVVQGDTVQDGYVQDGYVQDSYVQGSYVQGSYVQGGYVQDSYVQDSYVQGGVSQGQDVMEHVFNPNYGYSGPGDMRTHLWKDHGDDLKANGVSKNQLMSMSTETVQKWHNFFHGTEGRPQH